jgi:uncharacterized membrane protein
MQSLVLATALGAGLDLGFSSNVFAQETHSYIVDLNSKTVTDLGTLGGNFTVANGINEAGQVVGYSIPPRVKAMLSSPASTAWA